MAANMQALAPGVAGKIGSEYGLNAGKADAIGAVCAANTAITFSTCVILGPWDTAVPESIWQ